MLSADELAAIVAVVGERPPAALDQAGITVDVLLAPMVERLGLDAALIIAGDVAIGAAAAAGRYAVDREGDSFLSCWRLKI